MPKVKLENTTARILHISLGGGKNVAVPPAVGGIKVSFSDAEYEAFQKNLATPEVQGWIDAGDLACEELAEAGEAEPEDEEAEEEGDES